MYVYHRSIPCSIGMRRYPLSHGKQINFFSKSVCSSNFLLKCMFLFSQQQCLAVWSCMDFHRNFPSLIFFKHHTHIFCHLFFPSQIQFLYFSKESNCPFFWLIHLYEFFWGAVCNSFSPSQQFV